MKQHFRAQLFSVLLVVVLVLSALPLGACSKSKEDFSDTYNAETDCQYTYLEQGQNPTMAESPDGYYFLAGSYLFYMDKSTHKTVPLCDKPNCKHIEETDETRAYQCNAFFVAKSVFYQNGSIYVVEQQCDPEPKDYVLEKVSGDGSSRQTMFSFGTTEPLSVILHRGYLYYISNAYNAAGSNDPTIYRVPIGSHTEQAEAVYTSEISGASLQDLSAYGSQLYFNEYTGNMGSDPVDRMMWYDLSSKQAKVLKETRQPDEQTGFSLLPPFLNLNLTKVNLNDGSVARTEITQTNLRGANPKSVDNPYNYIVYRRGDGTFTYVYLKDVFSKDAPISEQQITVCDSEGKTLVTIPTPLCRDDDSRLAAVWAGSADELFFCYDSSEKMQIFAVAKKDFAKGRADEQLIFEGEYTKLQKGISVTPQQPFVPRES